MNLFLSFFFPVRLSLSPSLVFLSPYVSWMKLKIELQSASVCWMSECTVCALAFSKQIHESFIRIAERELYFIWYANIGRLVICTYRTPQTNSTKYQWQIDEFSSKLKFIQIVNESVIDDRRTIDISILEKLVLVWMRIRASPMHSIACLSICFLINFFVSIHFGFASQFVS